MDVLYNNIRVRLFFCRRNDDSKWRVLLTTDTKLDFQGAYKIYSMRWSIEICFADCKRSLRLEQCSAQNFAAQLTHIEIAFLQFNLLSVIKRFHDYETMGNLFGEICYGTRDISVAEKIWGLVQEVVRIIAQRWNAEEDCIIRDMIEDSSYIANLAALCQRLAHESTSET